MQTSTWQFSLIKQMLGAFSSSLSKFSNDWSSLSESPLDNTLLQPVHHSTKLEVIALIPPNHYLYGHRLSDHRQS